MLRHLPVRNPQPDGRAFIDYLMGRRCDMAPPLIEYLVDDVVRRAVVTDLLGQEWVQPDGSRELLKAYLDQFIEFWYRLGYWCVRYEQGLPFRERQLMAADTAPGSDRQRAWVDQHHGSITNWEEFESYPWPRVEEMDFFAFEYVSRHLPEGMALIANHGGGIFEHVSHIMSIEGLCLALHDDPELVRAVADRVGGLMEAFYRHLLDLDRLAVVMPGDDMGFRTQTLIPPDALRTYFLPWHRRFAAMAHQRGLPYFVHSCGNVEAIMEDLIEEVRIDGKHSFEDAILPVEEFHARYGDRIAALGGMDVNRLTLHSPEEVRRHTRYLMETCGARGRYAIGSGNSIPSYIPVENYLAMVDEALDVAAR